MIIPDSVKEFYRFMDECGAKTPAELSGAVSVSHSRVMEFVRKAVEAEREACAKLCDAAFNDCRHGLDACDLAGHLADVIRLRHEQ